MPDEQEVVGARRRPLCPIDERATSRATTKGIVVYLLIAFGLAWTAKHKRG
jgi:hypothetical protein